MYVITVTFKVKTESLADFRAAVLQQAKNSLEREAGCQRFDVCFADDRPDQVFLYEIYDDKAAFDAHLQTEHYAGFNAGVGSMVLDKAVSAWELQKL
jgi:quinol monooxygenase YgiN